MWLFNQLCSYQLFKTDLISIYSYFIDLIKCRGITLLLYLERQTIIFKEYCKLSEEQNIWKIMWKHNYIDISLPQEINTMKVF